MAMPDVRAFALYFEATRAFTVHQQSLSIPAGRQAVFGQEGYLAHSKGAVQVKLSLSEITPVGGSDFIAQLQQRHLAQQNITIKMKIGGKIISAEMAITSLEFSSNTETGVATGQGTFEGGVPVIS